MTPNLSTRRPNGHSAADPTANVIANLEAAVNRIDDLRGEAAKRSDDLREADEKLAAVRTTHTEFVAKLRAQHEKDIREQNNERLAALRLVDIATRNEDRKTADDAIRQLAAQTETLRQTLSSQVTDTAETLSKATLESDRAKEVRIAALEKTSYTGAGEKSVSDPALVLLADSVAKLAAANQTGSGERRGAAGAVLGIKDLVLFMIAVGSVIFALLKP